VLILFLLSIVFYNFLNCVKVKATTPVSGFVSNAYSTWLNRTPDPTGLLGWENLLSSGKISGGEFFQGLSDSTEFKSRNTSNSQYINIAYKSMLGRDPDPIGYKGWFDLLNSGFSRTGVLSSMVNSIEFRDYCKTYNLNAGSIELTSVVDKNPQFDLVVARFYRNFLGRDPDSTGLNDYVSSLVQKSMTIAQMSERFIFSDEFKNSNVSNEAYITKLFETLFNREPDSTGFSDWTSKMRNGYSRRAILSNFIGSQEFIDTYKNYGVSLGSINLVNPIDTRPDLVYFVIRFYDLCLSRTPDEVGLNGFVNDLAYKKITASQLVYNFIQSQEFINSNINANKFIDILYSALCSREADSVGLSGWINLLQQGYSRNYIAANIINSDEFISLVANYGIVKGNLQITKNDIPSNGIIVGLTIGQGVGLRNQPSLSSSSVILSLPSVSKAVVVNKTNSYYYVRYVDSNSKLTEGYVYRDSLDIISDDTNSDMLGVLSGKYESNGNPGIVSSGVGDPGGKSYGAWQMASAMGTVNTFMSWLSANNINYYNAIHGAYIADSSTFGTNFDNTWRNLASANYDEFFKIQHAFIKTMYYDPLIVRLLKDGSYDTLLNSFSLRNVLWSLSVQHGVTGAENIVKKVGPLQDKILFINNLYTERSRLDVYFPSCPTLWTGLANRFTNEKQDALGIYNYELQYIK